MTDDVSRDSVVVSMSGSAPGDEGSNPSPATMNEVFDSEISYTSVGVDDQQSSSDSNEDNLYTVQIAPDSVIPVYSSVEDDIGNPVAYAVDISGIEDLQEQQEVETVEYTDNELLTQLLDNHIAGLGVQTALVGVLVGFLCAVEVLKIWLQS